VSVLQSDVQIPAEPGFAFEFVLRVIVIECIMVFGIELSGVASIFKEYRQLEFAFHALGSMYEVD